MQRILVDIPLGKRAVLPPTTPSWNGVARVRQRCNIHQAVGRVRPAQRAQQQLTLQALPSQSELELDGHDEFGSPEFPDLSPDTVAMWNEIHSNIIELNRSRLKALQELKYARNRLNELELQLADRDAKITQLEVALEQAQWNEGGSVRPMNGTSKTVPKQQDGKRFDTKKDEPMKSSNGTGRATAAPVTGITIKYFTGWDPCYIHYNADNKGWTNTPGEKLEKDKSDTSCWTKVINCSRVEFVMNNGSSGWDKLPTGANYTITEPGNYTLRSGRLEKTAK